MRPSQVSRGKRVTSREEKSPTGAEEETDSNKGLVRDRHGRRGKRGKCN
jgi:hypothetical protein